MKKLIAFSLCLCAYYANAQTQFSHTASNPTGLITNTGVDTLTVDFPSYNIAVGIQLVVTKGTGTVAGIARVYGSIDGTNYVATGDTLTLADVSKNTQIWKLSTPVYRKYKIQTTGSGTMTATTKGYITGLKN